MEREERGREANRRWQADCVSCRQIHSATISSQAVTTIGILSIDNIRKHG
jgi:hypothetical protein